MSAETGSYPGMTRAGRRADGQFMLAQNREPAHELRPRLYQIT
jgi:hypothetical protein